jgi:hypothetical protein
MESATTGKLLTVGRNSSTGERGVRKRTRLVRRGAGGKGLRWQHLACCLPYYPLSYRDLEEMMPERGLHVDHTTIYRWVQHYAPELEKRCRPRLKATNESVRR